MVAVVPIDETALIALVDAARLSTAQLERISQVVFGTALSEMSNASTPGQQAHDLITYAKQYDLLDKLAAGLLYTGADRPGLQNLLLGHEMSVEDTRSQNIALDLVKLESRMERMFDRMDAKLDAAIAEMRHARAEAGTQPVHLTGKMLAFLIFVLTAMVVGQISLLSWVGALPHG